MGGYFGEGQGKKLGRGSGFYACDVRGDPVYCLHVYCANNSSDMSYTCPALKSGIFCLKMKGNNQIEF